MPPERTDMGGEKGAPHWAPCGKSSETREKRVVFKCTTVLSCYFGTVKEIIAGTSNHASFPLTLSKYQCTHHCKS